MSKDETISRNAFPPRVFLLSPARTTGQRASYVLNDAATFEVAVKIRSAGGATIGEVFSFLSGLYFRGKLAYASRYARTGPVACPCIASGALVITQDQGLLCASRRISLDDLRRWRGVDIDADNPVYRTPLARDVGALSDALGPQGEAVLLGSIATGKYVDVLHAILGRRLKFPGEFVGRGDMSRGGLMLRAVRRNRELKYIALDGAVRHGKRPAKLVPQRASASRKKKPRSLSFRRSEQR
jgi:hypothetical protein